MITIPYPAVARSLTLDYDGPRWTAPHEVQALCWLAKDATGGVLEIGCNEGRTLRELALACPQRPCLGIDYTGPDGGMCGAQANERPAPGRLGAHARDLANVQLADLRSRDLLPLLRLKPRIGMIFIDGNHTYEGVKADTELAFDYFAERGTAGVIAWHDCYENGPESVLRACGS